MLDPLQEILGMQCDSVTLEGGLAKKMVGNVLGSHITSFNLQNKKLKDKSYSPYVCMYVHIEHELCEGQTKYPEGLHVCDFQHSHLYVQMQKRLERSIQNFNHLTFIFVPSFYFLNSLHIFLFMIRKLIWLLSIWSFRTHFTTHLETVKTEVQSVTCWGCSISRWQS